jgi:uncharacterized membrane protein YvlD (DUF360 family)
MHHRVAIFLVAKMLPRIHLKSFGTAIVVAIVYSLMNFLAGWILILRLDGYSVDIHLAVC